MTNDKGQMALKEWAVAVDALTQGATILLLRKGGIREEGGRFQVPHREVLLYPTYEHQNPELLKPEYAQITPVASGWHPETVPIGAWAEIDTVLPVTDAAVVERLLPYHIWNQRWVEERLGWKPQQPLYLLLLRTYKLSQPHEIPYRPEYGGCRSWIELTIGITVEGATPVLSETEYQQRTTDILNLLG